MKTPIQELLSKIAGKSGMPYFEITMMAHELLQKEREVIENAFLDGYLHSPDEGFPEYARKYYNEKFKK